MSFVYRFSIAPEACPTIRVFVSISISVSASVSVVSLSVSLQCVIALDRINASVCPQFVLIDCLKSAAVYPQIDFIIMHSFRPPYIWTEIVHMCRASRSFSLSNGRHFDWETENRTETLRLSRVRSRFSTVRGIQLLVDPNGNWTCKRQNSCRH